MNTKDWGPCLWKSMFIIAANYPLEIDKSNKEHLQLKNHYKSFYISFQYMLPCKYCRESYKSFLKDLPIDKFLNSRKCLMYWLYLIKDKVNTKLIHYQNILISQIMESNITSREKTKLIKGVFRTTPSPPFEEICNFYEQFRAKCSTKTKSCSIPINKK